MHPQIEVHFTCQVCGETAAHVSLETPAAGNARLVISASVMDQESSAPPRLLAALRLALASGDPASLYAVDLFFAPFFCPQCNACYCAHHWIAFPCFDDDFPGWYDCTYAFCPQGHRRIIDD